MKESEYKDWLETLSMEELEVQLKIEDDTESRQDNLQMGYKILI